MKNQPPICWLQLEFDRRHTPQGSFDLTVLVHCLGTLRRLIHTLFEVFIAQETQRLLAKSSTSQPNLEENYELTCDLIDCNNGSIHLSLNRKHHSGSPSATEVFGQGALGEFKQFCEESIRINALEGIALFEQRFPEKFSARKVVSMLKALTINDSCSIRLRTHGNDGLIFDSQRDKSKVATLDNHLNQVTVKSYESRDLTIVAEVVKVDFQNRTCEIRTNDGLFFDHIRLDDLQDADSLFNPRLIEIDGTFEVDEHDRVQSIVREGQKRFVNDEPIEIREFQVDSEQLRADPPLKYHVEFFKSDDCYILKGDLDLHLYSFSRDELESMVLDVLQSWWREFVLADESKLAPSGLQKKHEIMQRIKPA